MNIFAYFVGYACIMINTIVVGHLGNQEKMAAVGVATTCLAITIYPIILGVKSAM